MSSSIAERMGSLGSSEITCVSSRFLSQGKTSRRTSDLAGALGEVGQGDAEAERLFSGHLVSANRTIRLDDLPKL